MFDKQAFRQTMRDQRAEVPQQLQPQTPEPVDNASLSETIHGIIEASQPFNDQLVCRVKGHKPMTLHIRLPPPMFFFIEHGSPFILSLIGDQPENKGQTTSYHELYEYQVRVCCASIVNPRLDIKTIKRLPIAFSQYVYTRILDTIAPPAVVKLMRVFYRQAKNQIPKGQLLEVYMMAKSNNRPTLFYLLPNIECENPYITAGIEKIIHEIGREHESRIEQAKFKVMSKMSIF